jgi:hypothetical protein
MMRCLGCGSEHDGWMAYCGSCRQVQAIDKQTKKLTESTVVSTPQASPLGTILAWIVWGLFTYIAYLAVSEFDTGFFPTLIAWFVSLFVSMIILQNIFPPHPNS